jgi:hypothetical protein
LKVQIPSHLVELRFFPEVRLRLALLKDRGIYLAIHVGQQRKHLVSNGLGVFGGVEHTVEMQASPTEFSAQREQGIWPDPVGSVRPL